MEIRIRLRSKLTRLLTCLAGAVICALLAAVTLGAFITGVLADERITPSPDTLEYYESLWPASPRIQARLAEARLMEADPDLDETETGARLACDMSPFDYRHRLLLATVLEAKGEPQAAETALAIARDLAPNSAEVTWRQANLLLRDGKSEQAAELFRIGCEQDPSLVPTSLDVMWRASNESPSAIESLTPADPESRFTLAQFLAAHAQAGRAADVFSAIPRAALADITNIAGLINSMVNSSEFPIARKVWAQAIGANAADMPLLWNGGFEDAPQKRLPQFDWQFSHSDYAAIRIDGSLSHSGSRSLKIEFAGKDTTKLDREITQQIVLQSGVRYRLQCFAKTNQLDTPEGPAIVVSNQTPGEIIAASAPISSGTTDWRPVTVNFTSPPGKSGYILVTVSIKRRPQFSYDEPTRGTIWLDDFSIRAVMSDECQHVD